MSPFEYVRAAYRLRRKLALELLVLLALAVIVTYHIMTGSVLDCVLR
jgi:hypothetical protein